MLRFAANRLYELATFGTRPNGDGVLEATKRDVNKMRCSV
jgi:hypothetical protein